MHLCCAYALWTKRHAYTIKRASSKEVIKIYNEGKGVELINYLDFFLRVGGAIRYVLCTTCVRTYKNKHVF